jgi:hypothetical protein
VALQIPSQYLPAIGKIAKLSNGPTEELIAGLSSAKISREPLVMAERIAASTPGIPLQDLSDILDGLYALYHVREFSEVSSTHFLNDLIEALSKSQVFGLEKPATSELREKFRRLLNVDKLNALSKAIRLQRDGERLFCEAKILSDMRPVFGEDTATRPLSAVITHTLKISYHEGSDHKEFFVVLDEEDLSALQTVISRAQVKSGTLTELLEGSGVPRLGI